jgi:hypothetical protein
MNFNTNAQNVILNSTINPLAWSLKIFKALVSLKEPAKIQGAAGGRPTRLTPENQPFEQSLPKTPKQQERHSEPLKTEPTKIDESPRMEEEP